MQFERFLNTVSGLFFTNQASLIVREENLLSSTSDGICSIFARIEVLISMINIVRHGDVYSSKDECFCWILVVFNRYKSSICVSFLSICSCFKKIIDIIFIDFNNLFILKLAV